jgi:hypothetical protein
MLRVPDNGGNRTVPGEVSGVRPEGGEGGAVAEQGAVQQTLEEAVGQACESAAARRVAKQFGMAESTVRGIDLRYLERWAAARRKPELRPMGVDEIHIGKKRVHLSRWQKGTRRAGHRQF